MNSLGQEPKFCIMHEKSVTQLSRLRTYQNVVFILIHFFTVLSETTTLNNQTVESCFTGPSNVLLQRFSEKKNKQAKVILCFKTSLWTAKSMLYVKVFQQSFRIAENQSPHKGTSTYLNLFTF